MRSVANGSNGYIFGAGTSRRLGWYIGLYHQSVSQGSWDVGGRSWGSDGTVEAGHKVLQKATSFGSQIDPESIQINLQPKSASEKRILCFCFFLGGGGEIISRIPNS